MKTGTVVRKMVAAPQSLGELRMMLCQMYADVSNDRSMVPQADSASNVAGKIINITRLELDALKISGKKPTNTKFLIGESIEEANK